MKTLNLKTTMLALLAIFSSAALSAQGLVTKPASDANYDKGFRLGFGVTPGYVFNDPWGFALGGDVRIQYDFSKTYSVTLTSGFTNLFADDYKGVEIKDLGFIPVKAGFKAFVLDEFYVMGEAGAGFAVTNNYDRTSAILAPSIGYANKFFDVSLRYEYYSDFPSFKNNNDPHDGTGQLAVRFAYGFRL
jgi:hypothetical protein